jgi:hypothetical protein
MLVALVFQDTTQALVGKQAFGFLRRKGQAREITQKERLN